MHGTVCLETADNAKRSSKNVNYDWLYGTYYAGLGTAEWQLINFGTQFKVRVFKSPQNLKDRLLPTLIQRWGTFFGCGQPSGMTEKVGGVPTRIHFSVLYPGQLGKRTEERSEDRPAGTAAGEKVQPMDNHKGQIMKYGWPHLANRPEVSHP